MKKPAALPSILKRKDDKKSGSQDTRYQVGSENLYIFLSGTEMCLDRAMMKITITYNYYIYIMILIMKIMSAYM